MVEGWSARARPGGAILAVAGAVQPDPLAARLDQLLSGWSGECAEPKAGASPPRGYAHESDETNQVQILVLHDAPHEAHPDSILEKVVISVLSGGMAGRLFTEVREKRGLCYSVAAGYSGGKTFGAVEGYVGTAPDRAQQSLDVLMAEFARLRTPDGAIQEGELQRALVGMKSRLVFSGESTAGRSSSLAYDMHRLGRPRPLDEIAREIQGVTQARINEYLARRTMGRTTIQTLGPAPLVWNG
jgi:predicted Zn-dependent peptidase